VRVWLSSRQEPSILCTALWRSYQISALERIGQSEATVGAKDFMLRRFSVFGTWANNEEKKSPPLGRRLRVAECRLRVSQALDTNTLRGGFIWGPGEQSPESEILVCRRGKELAATPDVQVRHESVWAPSSAGPVVDPVFLEHSTPLGMRPNVEVSDENRQSSHQKSGRPQPNLDV